MWLTRALRKMMANTFTLLSPSNDSLGMALHPRSALLNHSCDPNAFIRFDATPTTEGEVLPLYGSISVHAMRDIPQGEEVTIAYVDTTFPRRKRREELKTRYFFDCACELCDRGEETVFDGFFKPGEVAVDEIEERASKRLTEFQSQSRVSYDSEIDDIKAVMKELADSKVWPLYRYPWPQLRHQLFLDLLAVDRFSEASLQMSIFVRAIRPLVTPSDIHPLRIVEMWALVCLYRHFLQTMTWAETTQGQLQSHLPILNLTYCVLVGELRQLLNTGVRINGQLEKVVDAALDELSTQSRSWASCRRNPDEARKTAFSWLDKCVQDQLQVEGVSQEIVELARQTPTLTSAGIGGGARDMSS